MSYEVPAAMVAKDASTRAWRTLAQGMLVTAASAVLMVLVTATSGTVEWTPTYWRVIGLQSASAVLTAVVSYLARRIVPPAAP